MKAHVDVYKHWMLHRGLSLFRFFVLSRTKAMSESVYISSKRLTRSKATSYTKDLELSSQNSDAEIVSGYFAKGKETKVSRKRPTIKIEDTACHSLQTSSDFSIKTEDTKSEFSVYDQQNYQASVKREKWEPPDWRKQLENINEMRKNRDAPVDTMGCDVISDALASPQVL